MSKRTMQPGPMAVFLALLFGGWGIIGIAVILSTMFPVVRYALLGIGLIVVIWCAVVIDKGRRPKR